MYVCMYSYTNAGVAHALLLLVTCLRRKTLRGIKTSSHQYIVCIVPYSLQYLKKNLKFVLCWGEGEGRAIERVPGLLNSPKIPLCMAHLVVFVVPLQSQATLKNQGDVPAHP